MDFMCVGCVSVSVDLLCLSQDVNVQESAYFLVCLLCAANVFEEMFGTSPTQ